MSAGAAATMHHLDLPGGTLAVAVAGPEGAPALMLGHALGTDHRMWWPQIAALAGSFRVIVPDFRGHGASRDAREPVSFHALAADCAAIAGALSVRRLSYAGLSLGGVVGMELALGWPDLVQRMVLSNTRCRVDAAFAEACIRRAAMAREAGMTALVGPTIGRWFPPRFLEDRPSLAALFTEMFLGTRVDAYAGLCEELGRLDIAQRLCGIACPALVIGGTMDHTTPPHVLRDLAAHLRSVEVTIFENAAHFPNLEIGTLFSNALRGFLESQAPTRLT